MKVVWTFFNIVAIVIISTLLNLYFKFAETIPIWKFIEGIPNLIFALTPEFIADAAGIYFFALILGLFGLFYKPNRWLGFMLASWVYIFFKGLHVFSDGPLIKPNGTNCGVER